jgi:aminoglycoside phosphotransferase (APT) family kinase protein
MEVQEKHRFDQQRLARFMSDKVAGFTPPIRVEQFKGGQSNPTYRRWRSSLRAASQAAGQAAAVGPRR